MIKEWGDNKIKILNKKDKKFYESKLLSLNINKANKELKWEPRLNLNETIGFTIEWYKSFLSGEDIDDITNYQIEHFVDK